MKYFSYLLLFLLLTGCQTIAKKSYGIKNPKLENKESVEQFLKKHQIENVPILYFKDLQSFSIASKNGYLKIPDAFFFNKKGEFVTYQKTPTDCNANVDGFINELSEFEKLKSDPSKTIDALLNHLENNEQILTSKPDITIIISFTVYAGKLNKEKAFEWISSIKQAQKKGINVNYYLLNCDFQESWNMTKEELESLGLK